MKQNWLVYRLNKASSELTYVGSSMRRDPGEAAEAMASRPGEYVVFDLNYESIYKFAVKFAASEL